MRDMDHNCTGNGCRFAGCEQTRPTLTATEGSGAEPGAHLGAKPLSPAFYEWARSLPATDATVLTASIDGEPVTPEDVELMKLCEVCGGAKGWAERVTEGGAEAVGMEWWETCPPPPDGCGGTGKRGGR